MPVLVNIFQFFLFLPTNSSNFIKTHRFSAFKQVFQHIRSKYRKIWTKETKFWLNFLYIFWTPGLPEGILSNRPCPLVRGQSVGPSLNISETAHWFFLIFCMKLGHHKDRKVTEPDFWKKIVGVANGGKTPILDHFWCFFSITQKRL